MNVKIKLALASCCALAAASLSSCVSFMGPDDYVPHYNAAKPKTTTQATLRLSEIELRPMYDDEFIYDAKGNVLKHKQTEYSSDKKDNSQFVVWETEYKVVGGVALPKSVSVNGTAYLELEYELLPVAATGEVKPTTANRYFRVRSQMLTDISTDTINVALDDYPVDFKADEKFIKAQTRFSNSGRMAKANVLTLGFDNIVLKKYSFSREKLAEGLKKSLTGFRALYFGNAAKLYKDAEYAFDFTWEVIGGKICQKKSTFYETAYTQTVRFTADMAYNEAGDCIEETWTVSSPEVDNDKPKTIFKQTFAY